jgi:hypothetical protein
MYIIVGRSIYIPMPVHIYIIKSPSRLRRTTIHVLIMDIYICVYIYIYSIYSMLIRAYSINMHIYTYM